MGMIRIAFVYFLLAMGAAFAQSDLGTITGTVTDPAGALMPGVRVEAQNTRTKALHQVASTSTGNYTIAQLPAGTYQISISLPGFKPYVRTGITVLGAQTIRIDIVMTMLTSDEILTNESIIRLVKVGIDEDVIISKIQNSQCNFDLSVQGMVSLKESGISDRLMHLMMNPTKQPEAKATPPPAVPTETPAKPVAPKESPKTAEAPAPTPAPSLPKTAEVPAPAAAPTPSHPKEIGVYVKRDERWIEIQSEVVTYHTGGMLARLATAGVVQNDLYGRVNGAHSPSVIQNPLEFLIIAADGVAITEYQLMHLREERKTREFLAVIGGIFSSSGGAARDLLKFEGTKVASRTFSVKLSKLDPGEYGFLMADATTSSSKVGKMFTFRVVE
jgi:cell division septation protein DedD